MIDIIRYVSMIEQTQGVLLNSLHSEIAKVQDLLSTNYANPKQLSDEAHQPVPDNNFKLAIVGGVVLAGVGLLCKSPFKAVLVIGGLSLACYGYLKKKGYGVSNRASTPQQEISFHDLASRVNRELTQINSTLVDSWDSFLAEKKSQLKKEILDSDQTVDVKSEMLNFATTTTILDYSVSSLYPKLIAAANQKSVSTINAVLSEFENDYQNVIADACQKQIDIWTKIK